MGAAARVSSRRRWVSDLPRRDLRSIPVRVEGVFGAPEMTGQASTKSKILPALGLLFASGVVVVLVTGIPDTASHMAPPSHTVPAAARGATPNVASAEPMTSELSVAD